MRIRIKTIVGLSLGLGLIGLSAVAAEDVAIRPGRTEVSGVAIKVSDLQKAAAFYNLIGFQETGRMETPQRMVVFNIHQSQAHFTGALVLFESKDAAPPEASRINRIMFIVKDAQGICKKLADAKTPCTGDPKVVPQDGNAIVGLAKDPDGNLVELIQLPK